MLRKKATSISSSLVHSSRTVGSTLLENKVILSKAAVVIVSAILIYYADLTLIFGNALEFNTGNITNYVITIPFLSAFILYRKRNILKATAMLSKGSNSSRIRLDDVLGITLCAIAIIFYIASTSTLYALEYHILSLPIFLSGSTMLVFNLATLRHSIVAIMLTFYLQPPPGQLVSELAADLSWTSAVIVQGLLGSLGLPISIDSSLGAPALVIEGSDGTKTPFFVGEPSSGVFSTLGLSLFAVFVAYIIRGPTWKRLVLFVSGFPLFYLLNTLRIAIVLSLWYLWGQDVSEVYHTISGSSMVAIGTLIILLVAEKVLKLNIRSPARLSKKCDVCNKCLTARETMCLSCGRLLGRIKYTFGKSIERIAVVIFISLIAASIVVTSTYNGDVSKKLSDLDISKIKGPETTEYLLPQISGWDLKYAYRDNRVESILNQDAALAFRYLQTSNGTSKAGLIPAGTVSLYSSVQISTGHHVWEDSLVTYPSRVGRPGATLLESEDITISGEKQGRLLVFKRLESTTTEAVVYWFERTPLKFGSDFENRNVLISIWANTDSLARTGIIDGPEDIAGIKKLYMSLAKPIAAYWHDQTATLSTGNELLFGFVNKNVYSLLAITCIPLALFWLYHEIKRIQLSSRMHLLYHRLAADDKQVVEALLHSQSHSKHCTGISIAKSYAEISNKQLNSDQLTNLLRVVRRSGLITDTVASVNDESMLVWRINFSVKNKNARAIFSATMQTLSKVLQPRTQKSSGSIDNGLQPIVINRNRMKIAILCRRYFPEIGGVETHVKETAERLSKEHEVVVFTLVSDGTLVGSETINGVNVRRFKSLGLSYSAEIPPSSLLRQVEEFNPDIIHAHSAHTSIPYFASRLKCKAKLVVTPHYQGNATTAFRRILSAAYKPMLNSAFSKADRIICVSSAEREMLSNAFTIDQQKVRIVPNGVGSDLMNIVPQASKEHELRILSVARFDLSHKKTDKLIRAFKILVPQIDCKLVLVGSGPDKEEIVKMIEESDLDEKVELKSNLTREELIGEYAKASVFVTASEQEAFGIAVAEALAARLKVVVPNSTALSSFVKAGYAMGIELPVTPEKIAEAIMFLIQGKGQTAQYLPYTWDMAARDLELVYRELPKVEPLITEVKSPTYVHLLKTIGIPGFVAGMEKRIDLELMELARLNKIALLYAAAADAKANHQDLFVRRELLLKTLNEVSSTFKENRINYTIFKTIKPFPTTPSDIDVLLSQDDLAKAEALLMSLGYERTTHDAYSSTLERDMIVDLQVQPSVSNIPYLPKSLLMENSIIRRINGFDLCTLNPEAELIAIASHCFYKEQMFTMNDYYAITMLAEQVDMEQVLYLATRANVLEALQIVVGLCSHVTESVFNKHLKISELHRIIGAAHGSPVRTMPFKFPLYLIIKLLIRRAIKDEEMRRTMVPAILRIASPKQFLKLLSHITRKTY